MPKVSVIVPVYNAESTLAVCIDSVLNQTYPDLELILVDDGSTDQSLFICKSYLDYRVIVKKQKNAGVGAARNEGLSLACGEYIVFLDSDDTLVSTAIDDMIAIMQKTDADVCQAGYYICDIKGNIIKTFLFSEICLIQPQITEKLALPLFGNRKGIPRGYGFVCGKMFRADILSSVHFSTSIRLLEDHCFNAEVLHKAKTVCIIEKPVYRYCVRESSATNRLRTDLWEQAEILLAEMQRIAGAYEEKYQEEIRKRMQYLATSRIIASARQMCDMRNQVPFTQCMRELRFMRDNFLFNNGVEQYSASVVTRLLSLCLDKKQFFLCVIICRALSLHRQHVTKSRNSGSML